MRVCGRRRFGRNRCRTRQTVLPAGRRNGELRSRGRAEECWTLPLLHQGHSATNCKPTGRLPTAPRCLLAGSVLELAAAEPLPEWRDELLRALPVSRSRGRIEATTVVRDSDECAAHPNDFSSRWAARSSSTGPQKRGRTATRFARRGIRLDALHTQRGHRDAIAKVIVFEYNALTPSNANRQRPRAGDLDLHVRRRSRWLPPRPLAERHAQCNTDALGSRFTRRRPPPHPVEDLGRLLGGIALETKRLWTAR